jgi:hypothetical protein
MLEADARAKRNNAYMLAPSLNPAVAMSAPAPEAPTVSAEDIAAAVTKDTDSPEASA